MKRSMSPSCAVDGQRSSLPPQGDGHHRAGAVLQADDLRRLPDAMTQAQANLSPR